MTRNCCSITPDNILTSSYGAGKHSLLIGWQRSILISDWCRDHSVESQEEECRSYDSVYMCEDTDMSARLASGASIDLVNSVLDNKVANQSSVFLMLTNHSSYSIGSQWPGPSETSRTPRHGWHSLWILWLQQHCPRCSGSQSKLGILIIDQSQLSIHVMRDQSHFRVH